MIGEVELPAICCVAGGNLAGRQLKRKSLVMYATQHEFLKTKQNNIPHEEKKSTYIS